MKSIIRFTMAVGCLLSILPYTVQASSRGDEPTVEHSRKRAREADPSAEEGNGGKRARGTSDICTPDMVELDMVEWIKQHLEDQKSWRVAKGVIDEAFQRKVTIELVKERCGTGAVGYQQIYGAFDWLKDVPFSEAFEWLQEVRSEATLGLFRHEATIVMVHMRLKKQVSDDQLKFGDAFEWLKEVYSAHAVNGLQHKAAILMAHMRLKQLVNDDQLALDDAFERLKEVHSAHAVSGLQHKAAILMVQMRLKKQVNNDKLTRRGVINLLEELKLDNSISERDLSAVAGLLTALQPK